jgi:hypothetical protein
MDRELQSSFARDIEHLFDSVGRDWINRQILEVRTFEESDQRSGGRRRGIRVFHPLAVSASHYLAARDVEKAHERMGDRLLRLAMLGAAVRLLNDVPRLADRVSNLVEGDDILYYATEFELLSAATYKGAGHSVRFVSEGAAPTFDILVDHEVEVECKQATPVTQRERRAADVWALLDRRLRAMFDRHDAVFFFCASVPDVPGPAHVEEIIQEANEMLDRGVDSAAVTHGSVRYRFARTEPRVDGRGIHGKVPHWFPDRAQHHAVELSMIVGELAAEQGRGCALAFDSRTSAPEPADVLLKQVRKTPRQFTGNRPAVVHADITSAMRRAGMKLNETTVRQAVRSWLERHPEITAVNVLAPPARGPKVLLTFHFERNPQPRYHLPARFLGVDWGRASPDR